MHDTDSIITEARQRYRATRRVRGLRKPDGAPDGAWWSVQRRKLRGGKSAAYLMLRWRNPETGGPTVRSLGRLD